MKILIGDAQPRVRFGLRILLEQRPGWAVAGEAEDAPALWLFDTENPNAMRSCQQYAQDLLGSLVQVSMLE